MYQPGRNETMEKAGSEIQLELLNQHQHGESFYLLTQETDFKEEFSDPGDIKENIINSIKSLSTGDHQKFYAITRNLNQVGVLSIKKKENHFPEGYFEEGELDFLDLDLSEKNKERRLIASPFYIEIYISENLRQQNIATLAIQKMLLLLKKEGHKEVFFHIGMNNEKSIKLVERLEATLCDKDNILKRYKLDI